MTLEDLLRVAFNAGRENVHDPALGWDWWWNEEGAERHKEYLAANEDDMLIDGDYPLDGRGAE